MSASRYFNEMGEPLMTAAQARTEAYLDEQYWEEYYGSPEYQDVEMDRYAALMEEADQDQQDGECPYCGKGGCEQRLAYDRRQRRIVHD